MTHLTGMGVRVQLSTHLSARVVYTTDTPTSLYYINTPPSLYDGGAYAGGCKLGMGISDNCSMHSRYTPFTHPPPCTPHSAYIYIEYGEAHTEGVRVHQYRLRISRYREGCVRATVKAFACPCRIYCGYPHLPVQMRRGDGEIQGRV